MKNKQGKTHSFLPLGAEPAGTLHIYYLKQTRLLVKTGTGIRELHTLEDATAFPHTFVRFLQGTFYGLTSLDSEGIEGLLLSCP